MFDPLTTFDDAESKTKSDVANLCRGSSIMVFFFFKFNFTNETWSLSQKAEVLIHSPPAVTLAAPLDRRVPLAGHLTRKDTLDEVIAFHDAEKNKTR